MTIGKLSGQCDFGQKGQSRVAFPVSRKPSKITEFLDTLRKAINEESKKKGYL